MENNNNNNNAGKILSSLLIGAVIGGTLGILFAPHKGSKTRRKIAGKSEDITNSIKEKFNTIVDETKNKYEQMTNKKDDIANSMKG